MCLSPSVSISRSFSVCLCPSICVFSDYIFQLFCLSLLVFFLCLSLLVFLSFSGSVFSSICVFLYFLCLLLSEIIYMSLLSHFLSLCLSIPVFFSPRPIIAFLNWVKQIHKPKIEFTIKRITNDNRLWILMHVFHFCRILVNRWHSLTRV